jgi:hypothetical protein
MGHETGSPCLLNTGNSNETSYGNHQAVQARRRSRGAFRNWRNRNHGHGGEGLRAAEGAHRALPRRGVRGGLPEAAIKSELLEQAIEAIEKSANTGKIGDGKIFVFELEQVIRIRTGETGAAAL